MPFIVKPNIRGIAGNKHAVSFTYSFTGDVPAPQSLGGVNFIGSICTLDLNTMANAANIPPLRALQFTQTYNNLDGGGIDLDGELIVFSPASGGLVKLPTVLSGSGTITSLSGVIPVVSTQAGKIQFGKRVDGNSPASAAVLHGILTATLFDFDLEPWISYGFVTAE